MIEMDSGVNVETVFIVDDDPDIREGLCDLLDSVGICARSFSAAEEFLDAWNPKMGGCLLLDVRLPGMSGMELQEGLLKGNLKIPIIIMTGHGDMPMVRKVMKAGAVEFLIKPFQKEELLHGVEQAFALDRARRGEQESFRAIHECLASLTPREHEVMTMVTAGLLNKQIAAELNLSEITVKLHRRRVMEKMKADSLAELVKLCEKAKSRPGSN